MTHIILLLIFTLLIIPGMLGVVLPIVPGIPYMFVMAVVFGLLDQFKHLTGHEMGILFVLTLVSVFIDHLSGVLGAKLGGASRKSLWYGFLGAIVGTIILPPFGGIAGLFVAVMIAEFMQHQNQQRALKAARGSVIGALAGIGINAIIGLIFIALFIVFAYK